MSNPEEKTTDDMQHCNEQNTDCGPGCNCGMSGSGGRGRMIAGIIILLVVGVLVARIIIKDSRARVTDTTSTRFAALPAPAASTEETATAEPAAADAITETAALSDLNAVVEGTVGVFVFLPAKNENNAAHMAAASRWTDVPPNGHTID